MSVLALDVGGVCGWARSSGANGYVEFKYDDHGRALANFSDWLEAEMDREPVSLLAIERPFGSTGYVHRMTMLQEGVAHSIAWSRNVHRTDRTADQVRKALLGFARLPKSDDSKVQRTRDLDKLILAAVQARGFQAVNEHAADACALLCAVEGRQIMGDLG